MGKAENEILEQMLVITENFEKLYEKFNSDIQIDSFVLIVLKGHLYIEHELKKLLSNNLKNLKNIVNDYTFSNVLSITFALDLIDHKLYDPINKINKLRNKCAHELNFIFTAEEFKTIEDTLSSPIKNNYIEFLNSEDNQDEILVKLRIILFTIWLDLYERANIPKHITAFLDQQN